MYVLLRRESWYVNLKHVHRLYCREGLQVRMRVRRKKYMSLRRVPPDVCWTDSVTVPSLNASPDQVAYFSRS
jgi:hypothetical protein